MLGFHRKTISVRKNCHIVFVSATSEVIVVEVGKMGKFEWRTVYFYFKFFFVKSTCITIYELLVKKLITRNFSSKMTRVKFPNFHTVLCRLCLYIRTRFCCKQTTLLMRTKERFLMTGGSRKKFDIR